MKSSCVHRWPYWTNALRRKGNLPRTPVHRTHRTRSSRARLPFHTISSIVPGSAVALRYFHTGTYPAGAFSYMPTESCSPLPPTTMFLYRSYCSYGFGGEQTDFNANCRKFVAGFLRAVVRAHPQHVGLVVPVASYLMHDSSTVVKKVQCARHTCCIYTADI